MTDIQLWGPADAPGSVRVDTVRGIYYQADSGGGQRNQLDLFLPRGKKDCPVVVFVHGGAWVMGDNRCCGLYSSVGEFLASRGIIAVLPNYRLSPAVKHPEHIKDVARAVAWVHAHVAEYGGRTDQMFLMGHSAGGHLVTLLATDERYLQAEGLSAADIKGVIAVSGPYRISPGKMDVKLGGPAPDAMRWDKMFPLRDSSDPGKRGGPGLPLTLDVFGPAFGPDADVRADASPVNHVRPSLPPFLLFYADNDLPSLAELAAEFHQALVDNGNESRLVLVSHRNHNSIIFAACQLDDPVAHDVLEFVTRHTAGAAVKNETPTELPK